jgi:hypothetical protein
LPRFRGATVLKDATTASKGKVELAEDGEDREGVAVQGNDLGSRTPANRRRA